MGASDNQLTTSRLSWIEKIGMKPELAIGYMGLLLFMIGDGVEAGYLSPFLLGMGFGEAKIALVFTLYGVSAAIASWLSGVLSDIFGPKKVMWAGFAIWMCFEIPFLLLGISAANYKMILITYMLRGFGYPLFAFGFLVWVTRITPPRYLGAAVGWFWCARTGGLPTLGSLFASYAVPHFGPYLTLWMSSVLVTIGGLIAMFGIFDKSGSGPLIIQGKSPLAVLFSGISIAWKRPKVGLGGIVATITTTSEFGFLVCLPIYFTKTVGFTLQQWLQILSIIFATNVFCNLMWGKIADHIGWRMTITFAGGLGCTLTTLGLFYAPNMFGANYLLVTIAGMAYGAALAGFVPIAAIMARLAPGSQGAAMSIMNLGSGLSICLGPAIVGVFLPLCGIKGVIWIFSGLYLISAFISYTLKLPSEVTASKKQLTQQLEASE